MLEKFLFAASLGCLIQAQHGAAMPINYVTPTGKPDIKVVQWIPYADPIWNQTVWDAYAGPPIVVARPVFAPVLVAPAPPPTTTIWVPYPAPAPYPYEVWW
jgi:hypothetical protein